MNIDIKELVKYIENKADKEIPTDDNDEFNPMDASGSNFDDAFEIGIKCGEVYFARQLLGKFFPKEEKD